MSADMAQELMQECVNEVRRRIVISTRQFRVQSSIQCRCRDHHGALVALTKAAKEE